MSEEELNEKIDRLEKKRASFTRSRSLCAVATVFLGYNFYTSLQQETPPIWFLITMSAIVLTCAALGFHGHKIIKSAEREIKILNSQLSTLNEIEETTTE